MLQVYNEYKKAYIKQLILQKRLNTKHIFSFYKRKIKFYIRSLIANISLSSANLMYYTNETNFIDEIC